MSVTFKIIELIDRLHLQKFFMEKDNKILLNISIDPNRIEELIDRTLKPRGKNYKPNQFELDCINELER